VQQVLEVVVLQVQLVCKVQPAQLAVVQQEQPVQQVHLVLQVQPDSLVAKEIKVQPAL
jgi:hypothetical protein